MKKLFYLIFIVSPVLAFAQLREILVTAPDTIRDGKFFSVTLKVLLPIPNDLVYLKAVPAYAEDSLLRDSLDLFPSIVQMSDTWTGLLFYKNRKVHPEDEWIKIQASYPYGIPIDSSKTIFARYGPFKSTRTNDQIRIIPNPIGTPGLPAEITIWRRGVVREAEIKIFDSFGHLVKDLSNTVENISGLLPKKVPVVVDSLDMSNEYSTLYTTWDGRNDQGTKVANGVYQLCVKTIQAEEAAIWKEKIGVIW